MQVETVTAWLFFIRKWTKGSEQLTVSIELQTSDNTIRSGGESGENLVAVGFENGIRQLHIGTEDEEAMVWRATKNDFMPPRLEPLLRKYETEVSTITERGLYTRIPLLEAGERFYFHYIIAENPYKASADYPDEPDVSTWFAVDQTKKS
ncbi:hypothetical protein GCM10027594_03570 [Hymenobacter agri]